MKKELEELGISVTSDELFDLVLTLEEKKDVADRCLIIKALLEEEKTQRKISADLQVSIAKITRGSNSLKIIGAKLRNYLKEKIK